MKLLIWLRSLIVVFVLFPLETVLLCFVALFVALIFQDHHKANGVIKTWGVLSCWLFGVKVDLKGTENIPSGGAMFLFNHSSFFDIFAIYRHLPFLRFGAKLELFSIPIFGFTMKSLGTLPIARGNREAAIRVLQDAVARAKKGEKFVLSPEGGRNTEGGLLPFKAGPFLFAIQAQIPLVPVVIEGASEIWPKGVLIPATKSFYSKMTLTILPPVPSVGKTLAERGELQEQVRLEMAPLVH